jgi:lipopolysaccharide transport system ATP-binding protein
MSSEIIISTKNAGKVYPVYSQPIDRLKQMIWRTKRTFYKEYWALHGVTVDILRGETVGIIGRNGSGKSTFLQIVCGTLTPTFGEAKVNGRIAALLELGAGFNPEFTGRENVFLAASILGLEQKVIEDRFDAIAKFAGIGDFINQPVKTYSSGMYARLAFAVAAHVDADILIIDEILAVGDAAFTQKCMKFIRDFQKHGTILFVSHDTSSVVALCNKVIWLEAGSVREIGEAKEVCQNYLISIREETQGVDTFKIGGKRSSESTATPAINIQDTRSEILQNSTLSNKIEIFDFNPNAPWFGSRGATITEVTIRDPKNNEVLIAITGGEEVKLSIKAEIHSTLTSPILGFYIKDNLGQRLLGDNSYLRYATDPVVAEKENSITATFSFQMPFLRAGDYSVTAAIADGTPTEHTQHHWIEDALFFKSHAAHFAHALIGLPMKDIELKVT